MQAGKSPYLKDGRLSDIIAAIQAMGVYPWAGRKEWEKTLDTAKSAENWKDLFSEHPEFFRLSGEWTTLRWRYTYDKTYDARSHRELNAEEIDKLLPDEKDKLTHKPLDAGQIEALIRVAIELHSRAIAQEQEGRWWKPVWITALMGFLGALIGALAALGGAYLVYLASLSP
jgi:ABC-type phosphate/phosphonate transport system permease subunit